MTTSSLREKILIALHTGLQSQSQTVARNLPLVDIEPGITATLRDGGIEEIAAYFNPPTYEFIMSPSVDIVVMSDAPETGSSPKDLAERDAALDTALQSLVAAFNAITNWPEQVMHADMLPPEPATHDLFGAAGMKGFIVPFEIEYWSNSRHG